MPEAVGLLMLQFLSWVAARPRTYAEAMDAWRSTCPRHTVWEDALTDGLIQVGTDGPLRQSAVMLTPRGRDVLDASADTVTRDPAPTRSTPGRPTRSPPADARPG
jgi:hypothetical protein